jgi:hypothetical protein
LVVGLVDLGLDIRFGLADLGKAEPLRQPPQPRGSDGLEKDSDKPAKSWRWYSRIRPAPTAVWAETFSASDKTPCVITSVSSDQE